MPQPKKLLKSKPSVKDDEADIMERFHQKKICTILPTNPVKKKDIFVEYRPKSPRDCMNYNISQTDTKMDAGTTKIHLQQTRAEYEPYPEGYLFDEPPPPPPKKKKRPSHGRGPVWLFLDEEWKRKVDAEQEIYKKEMEERLKRKIKMAKLKTTQDHADMLKRVGPDWFQELSPNQMIAVDELDAAIKKDLCKSTIINTQCSLAKLGLVLRPNHRHVAIALKYCCEDPIEFILILYQLTNPNRKSYSLNDRLLLSSVVHLSMRSVLREMHIRIPSPPRAEKPVHRKKRVKRPAINYKSPYIVPYTFEPEPPKHTGIYKNRHIQYPESQYFSYLKELKEEMAKCTLEEALPTTPYTENESLTGDESMMTILQREIDEELNAAQKKFNSLPHNTRPRRLLRPSIYKPCDKSTELFNNILGFYKERPEQYSRGVGDDISTSVGYSDYEDHYDYMAIIEEHEPKFIICGITLGRYGESIPIIGGVVADKVMDCKCTRKKRIVTCPDRTPHATDQNVSDDAGVCYCAKKMEEEEVEQLEVLAEIDKCTCWPEPVEGISSSTMSVSNLGSFVPAPSSTDEDTKERILEVKPPRPFICGCKQMVDIVLDGIGKQTEGNTTEDNKNEKPTFIVADTKLNEGEDPLPIISGVKAPSTCNCLQKYQKKIAKFEELRIREEVQETLKSCKKKFLISGVTTGPDGKPIYILSGTSEERPCLTCEKMIDWKKREQERISNMPNCSQFRQKFVISGVHHSPVGNVYVLSGIAPTKECDCMKLYQAYMEKHAGCLELYDRFVAKMKREAEEYLSELLEDEQEPISEKDTTSNATTSENKELESQGIEECENDVCTDLSSTTVCDETGNVNVNCVDCHNTFCNIDGDDDEYESFIASECDCGEEDVDKQVEIKRFIVLDKIPCSPKEQIFIIKRALASLAKDGFPLAKLPQAYKLPHFKLWMALRCGKYWTMEDRVKFHFLSKHYWRHLDKCSTYVGSPRLKMSNEQAWSYTWASAKYIKKLTNDFKENHYRKSKQGIISDGREFFPSMFDYELPMKTFRDCYFAYVPGKEESVFSNRPWKVFEYIDYKLIRIKKAKQKCLR